MAQTKALNIEPNWRPSILAWRDLIQYNEPETKTLITAEKRIENALVLIRSRLSTAMDSRFATATFSTETGWASRIYP